MEYRHILKVRPTGFVEGMNKKYVTMGEMKDDSKIFHWSRGIYLSFVKMEKIVDERQRSEVQFGAYKA